VCSHDCSDYFLPTQDLGSSVRDVGGMLARWPARARVYPLPKPPRFPCTARGLTLHKAEKDRLCPRSAVITVPVGKNIPWAGGVAGGLGTPVGRGPAKGPPKAKNKIRRFAEPLVKATCRAPRCDTEARAVLLLLVVDAVYVRTREATDPGPAHYPSGPERMGRIFNHPRAQGARPVRATVVRWPIYYPPPEPSGFSYRLRHGPISMSSPDSDLLRRGIIVASS
jgi:hypothetical protein